VKYIMIVMCVLEGPYKFFSKLVSHSLIRNWDPHASRFKLGEHALYYMIYMVFECTLKTLCNYLFCGVLVMILS
jgi:hypothetical protein